jgi:hypothetical protein
MINNMQKEKPKKKEGDASFERHARAIQSDIARLTKAMESGFKSIREDMATKAELQEIKIEVTSARREMATHAALLEVRDDVRRLNEIMVSKADLAETIRREFDAAPYARETEINELRTRMLRVEEELDIKPNRRAA